MKQFAVSMMVVLATSMLLTSDLSAQEPVTCASEYVIKAGDSLQKIAQEHYGDRTLYKTIVEATNAEAASDTSFARIDNPSVIQPGWKLCLPAIDGVEFHAGGLPGDLMDLSPDLFRNMTYQSEWIESGTVTLSDGEYRAPAAPGSAIEMIVTLTNLTAVGLLDGQGAAAVVLVTDPGGSGTFYDLAVVVNQNGQPVNVASASLGDRVAVQSVAIENDRISIDMLTHGPDDPLCCPTQRVMQTYNLRNDQLVLISSEVASPDVSGDSAILRPQTARAEQEFSPEYVTFDTRGLVQTVTGVPVPGTPYDSSQPPGPTGAPDHVVFLFDGTERMRIYLAPAYEDLWRTAGDPTVANNISQLRTILAKRPELPQEPLPYLPPANGYNDLAVQTGFLDFSQGSGIRFVGRFMQDASAILNTQLSYVFQGLTGDGEYYVSFEYPVATAVLPDDAQTVSEQEAEEITSDFQKYLRDTKEALNDLSPADFTPDLSALDEVIRSLLITPIQETQAQGITLAGVTWKLQEIQQMNGETTAIDDPDRYTLQLGPEEQASVRADCNYGKGTYSSKGNELTIEINVLTRAMCPLDSLSDEYIRMLNDATSYLLTGDRLHVAYGIDTGILVFVP